MAGFLKKCAFRNRVNTVQPNAKSDQVIQLTLNEQRLKRDKNDNERVRHER